MAGEHLNNGHGRGKRNWDTVLEPGTLFFDNAFALHSVHSESNSFNFRYGILVSNCISANDANACLCERAENEHFVMYSIYIHAIADIAIV